jgi:hypothetical protein
MIDSPLKQMKYAGVSREPRGVADAREKANLCVEWVQVRR